MDKFDAILIGAGQANNPLARSLAVAGWSAALVERGRIGGSCLNVGCTPTKAMVASAKVAEVARRAAEFGVRTGTVSVDFAEVRRRREGIMDAFRAGSERKLTAAKNLELIRGEARFLDAEAVAVRLNDGGERVLRAGTVVIDTGSRPARPELPGLDSVEALDSTSILALEAVPEHLLILGGGYIAAEYGQMFRRFGSAVTVVTRGRQLLPREDADIADVLAGILREDGIEVVFGAKATGVRATPGGVEVAFESDGASHTRAGSHLLLATGQVPNVESLNLPAAGVATRDDGTVAVNDRFETSVAGIYAVGDVNGGPKFTHVAHQDNQILRDNLLRKANRTTAGRVAPYTVFTDPQLGRVGLSEAEARQAGHRVRVYSIPMAHIARAVETGEARGLAKAVAEAGTGRILGAAILGDDGGEIASMIGIAMLGGVTAAQLRDGLFAHPTYAEGLNALFAD